MTKKQRNFISIYFSDGLVHNRKKRDVTLAFGKGDALYNKCKELGSSGIKELVEISSYTELVQKAEADDRTPSNYIKHRLKNSLSNE